MTTGDMNDDTKAVRSMLAVAFAERPMSLADSATREVRRRRAVSGMEAILAQPRSVQRRVLHRIHWQKSVAVLALAAGLVLVVSRLRPSIAGRSPIAAFSATESSGQVLCNRNDWANWTACDPSQIDGVVGLRTLDNAGVTLQTVAGVRMHLDAASTLLMKGTTTTALASQVTLTEGSVDVKVPKLGRDRRFSIVTPSATITVHGTAFSVQVTKSQDKKPHTCVRLREGVVSVEAEDHEYRLTAPATWGCDTAEQILEAPSAPRLEADTKAATESPTMTTKHPGVQTNRSGVRQPISVNPDRSTLAVETSLLQRALAAERRGDLSAAEGSFKQLLSVYPNSVVAPEARAALERISGKANGKKPE